MTQKLPVKQDRMIREFMELTSVDSVSFGERQVADILIQKLLDIGFEVKEDNAGEYYQGTAGNIYAFYKGELAKRPILLSAHMDTVQPGIKKKPILHEDGKITSDGTTVLGADDVAGLVEILEGIRAAKTSGLAHRSVEVLFSIGEEEYDKGTKVFDFSQIQSKDAYILDMSGAVGAAAIQAPSIISFEVVVTGKASHAGFAPEHGINAIQLAAQAIAKIKQGHIDEETTLNIGGISGGTATNIVSEQCICTGEVRSFSHEKALQAIEAMRSVFVQVATNGDAEVEVHVEVKVEAYRIDKESNVVQRFVKVCKQQGLAGEVTKTFGGSDNNMFAKQDLHGIVLSCGMYNVHSTREYAKVEDLEKGAQLVAGLIVEG